MRVQAAFLLALGTVTGQWTLEKDTGGLNGPTAPAPGCTHRPSDGWIPGVTCDPKDINANNYCISLCEAGGGPAPRCINDVHCDPKEGKCWCPCSSNQYCA